MKKKIKKLIAAVKQKRQAEGLSIRRLSSIIGVSFSSLARMERGEGEPDNNSIIRMLEWLGDEGRGLGLTFEDVALVHFRASKNVQSKTVECLLQAADALKRQFMSKEDGDSEPSSDTNVASLSLSKQEMEEMAEGLRRDCGLGGDEPLDALKIQIEDVDVYVAEDVPGLPKACLSHLTGVGTKDWSAMSVPLDSNQESWAIVRNGQHNIQRQRVTYLEECWHILLGHRLTKIAKIAGVYGRTYDPNEEHDAYFLATASLLPEREVRKRVAEQQTAEEIAEHFGVSRELVEYRIKRLGLWANYRGKTVRLG